MSKSVKRLYKEFQPSNYNLTLDINEADMSFSGTVIISGRKVGRPSKRLTLHQNGLKITSAEVIKHDKNGDQIINIDRINNQQSLNELRLHSDKLIYPGSYTIKIEFNSKITKKMHGIYPSFFTHNDKPKTLFATQFESHHAREAFPCVDEPEAKATFDLTIKYDKNHKTLSNTLPAKQTTAKDRKTTVFETTPIMSTYLLAFVSGDIHSVSAQTKDKVTVSSWGTIAQPASSMQFANNEAVKILEFFTEYFGTAFPLKKIDQIALPDFESGAMENWGLITYREIALLTDANNKSLSSEQYVSMVVAHEISHQWFGNLVTMKWWDDLWLNESFASIMEHIALDNLHPDWHQWETYAASDVLNCSNRDIYKDVQPVRTTVNHPDEIGALFDPAIVYAKGGRLLKMLREYIGDDAFRKGLKNYFAKHAYKNTARDDLWASLAESSGQDIHGFMDPWLEQSGMPVLTLSVDKDNKTSVSQERFVLDKLNDTTLWPVPLLSENVQPKVFSTKTATLQPTGQNLILNQHASGHYIVNYGQGKLKEQVNKAFYKATLPSEARINYLNDLLLLARRGDISISEILHVVQNSQHEPRDAVWALMSRALGLANGLIEGNENYHKQLKLLRYQTAIKTHTALGWDEQPGDDPNTIMLRLTALGWVLGSGDKTSTKHAIDLFNKAKSVDNLNAEQRSMIISTVTKADPKAHVDALASAYQSTSNSEVQLAIASGLTSIEDKHIGRQLLLRALGDQKPGFVRSQDVFRWFAYFMQNRHTRTDAWQWLKDNWTRLYAEFNESKSLDGFVMYSAGPLNTQKAKDEFDKFFEPKANIVSLTRNIHVAQAEINARILWRNRDEAKVKQFLDNLK